MEVGGGRGGGLSDLQSGRIIREQMTPRLKAGDVGGAIEAGTTAIRRALGDQFAAAPAPAAPAPAGGRGGFPWPFVIFVLVALASVGGAFGRPPRHSGSAPPILLVQPLGG